MKSILFTFLRIFPFPFLTFPVFLSLCLILGVNSSALAQWDFVECATEENSALNPSQLNNPPCFDVNEIIANCTPVYLRVNFHFFVANDCTGSFDVNHLDSPLPQEAAYAESNQPFDHGIAERMVYEMNQRFSNNQPQKLENGQYASTAPCVPLRFVLGDVQIHCDYAFRSQQAWSAFQNKYGQYAAPGINVYYSKHPFASGEGQPNGPGVLIGAPDAGLILHEIGHNLSLAHTFQGDGCPDTPDDGVDWDKTCDGDLNDDDGKESDWPCWEVLPPDNPWCNGTKCNPNYIVISPCCDPDNVYNNVMSYNKFKSAVTSCQIAKMLNTLSLNYPCDYIAQIGGECPPPAAVIQATPLDLTEEDCSFCLQGGASMNDDTYHLEIYEGSTLSSSSLFFSTGWMRGPVGKFCFTPLGAPFNPEAIKPGTNYKAILTVKNACGEENTVEYLFKTPDLDCTIEPDDPIRFRTLSPNPGSNWVNASFELPGKSPVWLTASSIYQPAEPVLLYQHYDQNEGESTVSFDVSNWEPGVYTIQLISNFGAASQSFIKF